jgi:hypothetical protein
MNTRIRILMALLGCLVIGVNALAADLGHCDPICCEAPCDPVLPAPVECGCCAATATAVASPMLTAPVPTSPAPALLPVLPALAAPRAVAAFADHTPAPSPATAPARSTILRN